MNRPTFAVAVLAAVLVASSVSLVLPDAGIAHAQISHLPLKSTTPILGSSITGSGTYPNTTFGFSFSDIGDLDNDGTTDLVIGAPGLTNNLTPGVVYVTLMNSDGSVKNTIPINAMTPNGPPGLAGGDRLGNSVAGIGDLNRDGIPDIAAGAPGPIAGPSGTGNVYVMLMNRDGSIMDTITINSQTPNIPATLAAGDRFGWGLAGMGDLDNDGTPEIAVGVPGHGLGGTTTGEIFVMYMNSNGSVKRTAVISPDAENGPTGLGNDDLFGWSLANIGDLDNDGTPEVAVGAPGHVRGGADPGKVFVIYLNSDGTPKRTVMIGPDTPNVPALIADDRFGNSIAGVGDRNNDGIPDISVSAPSHPINGVGTGDVYIFYMNRDGSIQDTVTINNSTPNGPSSVMENHKFGVYLSNIRDLDGDGVAEFGASALGGDAVYVFFMNTDGTIKRTADIRDTQGSVSTDRFGQSLAGIGDLDRDGTPDMLVGVPGRPILGNTGGDAYLVFLNSDGSTKRAIPINSMTTNGPSGITSNDNFGWSVANAGDLNRDGVMDIAVGAPGESFTGTTTNTGDVYVMLMNSDGSVDSTMQINDTTPNGPSAGADSKFGWSIAGVGDIDGDGTPDIAAGAPNQSLYRGGATATTGDVYVMMMNSDGSVKRTVEINGQVANGPNLAAGDRFGESIAGIGDLDGDGVPDMLVGAPGHSIGGVATGDAYLIFMNRDGTIKRTVEINGQTPSGPANLALGDRFGASALSAGDLDRDGTPDVMIGAPGHLLGNNASGSIYAILLESNGTVKRTMELNALTPNGPGVDGMGWSVASIGDLDGDGRSEIATGIPSSAYAYVSFTLIPPDYVPLKMSAKIDGSVISGMMSSSEATFGIAVSDIGDLDNDGTTDLAIGAPGLTNSKVSGNVYITLMNPNGSVKETININAQTPNGPIGHGTGDRFGQSVVGIGDLNRDGIPDIAAGAPGALAGPTAAGDIYVMLLNRDGTVQRTVEINDTTQNGPVSLADGDRFGWSLAALGDIDGDGIPDMATGAPGTGIGGIKTGDAYVILMNRDGTPKSTIRIDSTTPNGPSDIGNNDLFGWKMAGIGDLDNDGTRDLLVGAPGHVSGGAGTGDAYIILLNSNGTPKRTIMIGQGTPGVPTLLADDRFGDSVASLGDRNSDGIPDIAIGAPSHPVNGRDSGSVYIFYMNRDGTIQNTITINSQTPNGPDTVLDHHRLGVSLSNVRDLDGDGVHEIAAGTLVGDSVYVMFMNADGTIKRTTVILSADTVRPDTRFGNSVAGIGDLNRDGIPDMFVGAPGRIIPDQGAGDAYILFMGRDGSATSTMAINDRVPNGPSGLMANDYFGWSVTGVGDINGDGIQDVAAGAPGSPFLGSGTGTGDVYVMLLNTDGTVQRTIPINSMTSNGPSAGADSKFGWSVAGVGDIDGNGTPDIAAGAPNQTIYGSGTSTATGDVYVMMMNSDGTIQRTVEINAQVANGPNLAAGDRFGESVAGIGDLDGDGIPDIAAGAPSHVVGVATGDVYVMFMNRDGTIQRTVEINGQTQNGPVILADGDRFGSSIISLDIDGDGIQDILSGAPGHVGGSATGDVYAMIMNRDGTIQRTLVLNSDAPNGPSAPGVNGLGWALAAVGDLDANGMPEIAIGAPSSAYVHIAYVEIPEGMGVIRGTVFLDGNGNGMRNAGEVGIPGITMTASTAGMPKTSITGSDGTYSFIVQPTPATTTVRTVLDADRLTSMRSASLAPAAGQALTFDVGVKVSTQPALSMVLPLKSTTPILGSSITGSQTYPNTTFGFSFSDIGDLDNDGTTDLAIGAPGLTDSLMSGVVYVTLMNADGSVKNTIPINSMTPNGPVGHGGGDRFGNSVAGVGDIDGDGIPDIVAGAPGAVAGPSDTGNVYLMMLNRDGTIKRTVTINAQTPNIPPITTGDRFGWALAGLGDLNRDGIPDIAVGSPGNGLGGVTTGNVYILFMDRNGSVKSTMTINTNTANGPFGLTNDDLFGWSVASIGDLDRDGTTDMAIGAPGHIRGGAAPGKMFIMYLNPDGTIKSSAVIESGTPGVPALVADDRFANSIAGIGDRNRDGIPDIAVSAPGHLVNGVGTGDVYVFYMNSNGTIQSTMTINDATPNGPRSVMSNHTFGVYLSNIRDLDNDGVAELGASALGGDSVYVFFMNADGTIKRTAEIVDSQGALSTDRFGQSVAGIGDLDRDGVPDMLVGVPGRPLVGNSGGDVYVMFMNSNGSTKRTIPINSMTTNGPSAVTSNDNFGWSVTNIGDLDGDGVQDVAVGAPSESFTGTTTNTGDVYVMFMNSDGTPKRTMQINDTTPNGPSAAVDSKFGWSVAGIGDLDGDGTPDIAAGAPNQSLYRGGAATTTGDVYVMMMNPDGTIKRTIEINSQVANGPNLAAGDRFGESIAGIGDIDGDGVPDMLVGAPGHSIGGMATGDAYVIFMNSDGTIKRTIEINGQTPNGPTNLAASDRFGASATGIGDLDGDGTPDVLVGAPGHLLGNNASGSIYAMLMNANGTVKRTMELHAQVVNGPEADGLGWSVAGIGDLDGDGRPEIAMGVPSSAYAYVSFTFERAEYVPLKMSAKIDGVTVSGMMPRSVATFGQSVSDIGDLDGDGIPDIAAGAPGLTNSKASGDVYITLLNSNGSVKDTIKLNSQTPNGPTSHGSNDRFGQSVVGIGDLNGDGIPDIAAGAPGVGAGPTVSGYVYIMMMNRDGTIQRTVEINDTTPNGPVGLVNGDHFGWALAGMGDLNGDGIPDIAAGAPGPFIGGVTTGDVYIMMMNRDGSVKDTMAINDMVPNGPTGLTNDDLFGRSIANIGDLDGDGTTDMAIGAPGHGRGGADAGKVFITYMNSNGTVKKSVMIGSGTPGVPALVADDRFGHSVSGLGDSNSDGIPDIAVAAPSHPVNGADSGDIYVFNMNRDGTIRNTSTINSTTTNGPNSVQAHHKLGVSLTNLDDLDGDGVSEIAAGAGIGNSVYVMFMNADGTVKRTTVILSSDAVRPDNRFGNSVAGIGDLNRDGIPDMFVGMPGTVVPGGGSGDAYVLLMNTNGAVADTIRINAMTPNGPSGLMANDYFGWSVAGIGDLDGDGVQDVAAGAPGAPFFGTGTGTGSAYVMLMNPDGTIKNTIPINSQTPNGPSAGADSKFGWSVAGVGDIDDNGTPDVAVGAPNQSFYGGDAATATGDVYVMMMNSDGTIMKTVEINAQVANGPNLAAGDRFGESVAGIGDLDGDGIPDIAVGAPSHVVGVATGDVYVMFMNRDGTIQRTVEINGQTRNGPVGLATGDRLGSSIISLDIDGDGIQDILSGAPGHVGGSATGDVYAMIMNRDGTIQRTLVLNSDAPNGPSAPGVNGLGWALAAVGDLDANGMPEIAIGAPSSAYVHIAYTEIPDGMGVIRGTVFADGNGNGMRDAGEAGMAGVRLTAETTGMPTTRSTMTGSDGTYSFVVQPAPASTTVRTMLDADRLTSMRSATLAPAAGQALVFDVGVKSAPASSQSILKMSVNAGLEIPLDHREHKFGHSVADIGDVNNDGTSDLAVGAPGLLQGMGHGEAYILFMNPDGTVDRSVLLDNQTPNGPPIPVGDRFGESVARAGDIDGDGVPDLLVGAIGHAAKLDATGKAHLLMLNRDGTVKRTVTIDGTTPNGPALSGYDLFGTSAAGIGDLNRDGIPDIAVGAPNYLVNGDATGDVYVMFMNRNGTVQRTVEINNTTPNGPALGEGDRFGTSVAGIGDLNNDGVPDIAAGAPGHRFFAEGSGDLFVMFMNADGTVQRTVEINAQTPNGPSLARGEIFGISVGPVGDLNRDGIPDIAAGSPAHRTHGGIPTGDVFVMMMNRDGTVQRTVEINNTVPNGPSLVSGSGLGASVTGIGDRDGDGIPEIAAGTLETERVHISFMNSDGTIKRSSVLDGSVVAPPTTGTVLAGVSIDNIGDLDADGTPDLIVGAPGTLGRAANTGDAYVMFMGADGMAKRTVAIDAMAPNGPKIVGGDRFGASVAGVGDINGDGVPDVAVGAIGHAVGGAPSGDVFVMMMNRDGTIQRTFEINAQTPNGPASLVGGDRLGTSLAGVGDIDGDGVPEIAVGAAGHNVGYGEASFTGDIYLFFMNPDGTVKRTMEINAQTPNGPASLGAADRLGAALAGIGDIDGDGVPDIAAGSPFHIEGDSIDTGEVYIMMMNPDGTVKRTAEIGIGTPNGPALPDRGMLGFSLAGTGDIDGDGVPDIAAGSPFHLGPGKCGISEGFWVCLLSPNFTDTVMMASAHVMYMNSDGTIKRTITINSQTPNAPAIGADDYMGISLANAGDIDGDGIADMAFGAPYTSSVYVSLVRP